MSSYGVNTMEFLPCKTTLKLTDFNLSIINNEGHLEPPLWSNDFISGYL